MNTRILAALVAVAAAVPTTVGAQAVCAQIPEVDERCEAWVAIHDEPTGHGTYGEDEAMAVATTPDGRLAFVAGLSKAESVDAITIAYHTDTGTAAWVGRSDVSEGGPDVARDVAVSPDGSLVFAAGRASVDAFVEARSAGTGALVWRSVLDGPARFEDSVESLAVSPDGSTVYAAGYVDLVPNQPGGDLLVVAFDADTGDERWRRLHDEAGTGERGVDVAVAPDGSAVYAAAVLQRPVATDYLVVALEAADEELLGTPRWTATYHGGNGRDDPVEVAATPDGAGVLVTGTSQGPPGALFSTNMDLATLRLAAADGAQEWVERVNGPDSADDTAAGLVLAPDGGSAYVTGTISEQTTGTDTLTVAYRTADGEERWRSRFGTGGIVADQARDVIATQGRVYVLAKSFVPRASGGVQGIGASTDHGLLVTLAYDAETGSRAWLARHGSGEGTNIDDPAAVAMAGPEVIVTGSYGYRAQAQVDGNYHDIVTLAYAG